MIKKIKKKFKNRKIRKAQKREFLKSLPSAFDHHVLSWESQEHLHHKQGKTWKILMSLAVLVTAGLGIYFNDWTFSLAIIASAVVYLIIHQDSEEHVDISISEVGVKVGGRRYPFSRIKAFWIVYEPPYVQKLYIRVSDDLALDIAINLGDMDPAIVRDFMIEKVPEMSGVKESITDIFSKLFKI